MENLENMEYSEMKYILNLIGYSQKEFCDYINKSKSFLNSNLSKMKRIPIRYIYDLKMFLGEEFFNYGRAKYLESEEAKSRNSTKLS